MSRPAAAPSPYDTPSLLARGQRLPVNGLDYFLRITGPSDAPLLLLLHGLLDTGESYAPLVSALQQRWRVVAPDWRGHGDSEYSPGNYWFPNYVADLDDIASHYSPRAPLRIVSHSMGTTVASLFAGLRPERVSHLVCLDGLNVPRRRAEDIPARYLGWLDGRRRQMADRYYPNHARLAARIRLRYPELQDEQTAFLARIWSRPEGKRLRLANDPAHLLPSPYGFDPEMAGALWQRIQAPVLCLDGGRSPASNWISNSEMTRRRGLFPNLQRIVLPDCGHFPQLQTPAEVALHIERFLLEG